LLFGQTTTYKVVGWNDLGMHCMDGKDYSVYSILPPYNTFHAHVIDSSGKLVKSGSGISVTYQAVADPTGSINKSSIGKTNFWTFVQPLFGLKLAPDMGLVGFPMPGAKNTAVKMRFDAPYNWFTGEGVPISPYDDKGNKNYYPMMRIIAKNSRGTELARTDIVLPVSDELDCRSCHASGSPNTARPSSGWVFLTNDPERDYKLNVLKVHDDRNLGSAVYQSALQKLALNPAGLYATVTQNNKPVLCAGCHGSNALPGTGIAGIEPMTQAVHSRHANVLDPVSNLPLDSVDNRSACYRCHPGSETKCLRGAMGNAVAADGSMLMQCQSCHGNMSAVGSATRQGWFEEPSCQNCHTGTAVKNNGQIRYTSTFEASGLLRQAVDLTFATNANTPAAGLNLYRFSKGHGGLQCEACHGSTHAEFPSSHTNDNLQSVRLQGHVGMLAECTACHSSVPSTTNGGPHGLHPIGQSWVSRHGDVAEHGSAACQSCHGLDYRGTVLSRTQADRSFSTEHGTKTFAKGTQIGCYSCHNGPRGGD
jgi:hypothetical protein